MIPGRMIRWRRWVRWATHLGDPATPRVDLALAWLALLTLAVLLGYVALKASQGGV